MVELFAAATEDKSGSGWAVLVAAVPALVTLVGTLWQIRAHFPASTAVPEWPDALRVRVVRLSTRRPATGVHPVLARRLVIWHLAIAVFLLGLLPLWPFWFLAAMAVFYLAGAGFYAWEYSRNHAADLESSAHLLVEGDLAVLCERLKETLILVGARIEAFDFTDPSRATITARVPGARLQATVTPTRLDTTPPTTRPAPTAPSDVHEAALLGCPIRVLDGFPRATQAIDNFIRIFQT